MTEEQSIDAESVARNKDYGAGEHLKHLLRIGHAPDSTLVSKFVREHGLQDLLEQLTSQEPRDRQT